MEHTEGLKQDGSKRGQFHNRRFRYGLYIENV